MKTIVGRSTFIVIFIHYLCLITHHSSKNAREYKTYIRLDTWFKRALPFFMKHTLTFIFLISLIQTACSQPNKTYSIKDRKAIKQYEEALSAYQMMDLANTRLQLEALVKEKPDFIEAQFMLAQVYDETGNTELAIAPLKAALAIDEKFYPAGWMMLAECYFAQGDYENTDKAITKFMPYPKESAQQEKRAQLLISSCVYAKRALAQPVPFEPINLGAGVNTDRDEYYPCITADEQTLLFTRLVADPIAYQGKQEDFYLSKKETKEWKQAQAVVEINTKQNEGAPTLSADGQMLIFTACEGGDGSWGGTRTGVGSCDLFYSTRTANGWTPAENMGNGINTGTWESQPSFSANGRTLYFIRGKRTASGIKEQDIYYSYLDEKNRWSAPVKAPGRVNTIFEEESVMIHPDGRTLYFSSNGHSGMGGLDIFMSRLLPNGDWDIPVNLGYPINTFKDENSIQVTAEGNVALFASDREGGMGGLDLYQFNLHEKARPTPVTYVKGIVTDKLSFKKLEAHLELIDLENGKLMVESYSNQGTGEFLLCIPSGKDYALNVNKDGYLFHSENFSLKNYTSLEPFKLEIQLQKLRPGATIVLNNVFFETNKWDLKPESRIELDRLADLLKNNPDKKIEIGGHTDNVGSDDANMTLSNNRAASVVEYLVKRGIEATRLTSKGYGESAPVATNDTDAGRAKNRRTEFKIL
jgi:outer membrane protein OmpA-like peptidoglycan-associated protein/tetratricopeptide (TPR) repeat protein